MSRADIKWRWIAGSAPGRQLGRFNPFDIQRQNGRATRPPRFMARIDAARRRYLRPPASQNRFRREAWWWVRQAGKGSAPSSAGPAGLFHQPDARGTTPATNRAKTSAMLPFGHLFASDPYHHTSSCRARICVVRQGKREREKETSIISAIRLFFKSSR